MTSHPIFNLVISHIRRGKTKNESNFIQLDQLNWNQRRMQLLAAALWPITAVHLFTWNLPVYSNNYTLLWVHTHICLYKIVFMTKRPSTRSCMLKYFRLLIVLLCSCLELLVCVLNILLASSPFTDQQLQALQSEWPTAIGVDGRFNTLKALSKEAKVDYSKTKVCMVYNY